MKVQFFASDPRQRAQPELDRILLAGTQQIAIVAPFLTPGGVELLRPHVDRLRLPASFVVVAWERPTALETLNELYGLIPGNLYLHLGSKTPIEQGLGRGLMHSKIFFAKNATRTSLWTGSHNLTASAALGVNCEAATVIEGATGEGLFADALAHLEQCRSEAIQYDPKNPPPPESDQNTLVIHAENQATLGTLPWHVHLRPGNTDYDSVLRTSASVWLYLYDPGALRLGRIRPAPKAVFSGTVTGFNATETHPHTPGTSANWADANYVVELHSGVPHLKEPTPHTNTPSQGIFRVQSRERLDVVWLSKAPDAKLKPLPGQPYSSDIDRRFRRFFTKASLSPDGLVHRPYRDLRFAYEVTRKEVGSVALPDLQDKLGALDSSSIRVIEDLKKDDKFAFIYRAKYRR